MKQGTVKVPKRANIGNKFLWVVVFVLLAGGSAAVWYFLGGPGSSYVTTASAATPDYHTATVKQGDLRIFASGAATLVANKTVDLSFSTNGTVAELNVKIGDHVTAGDVLAKLGDSETLEANLASAQLAYLQAKKTLTDLQQNSDVALAQAYADYVTAQQTFVSAADTAQRATMVRCSKEVNTQKTVALANAYKKLQAETSWEPGSDDWIEARNVYDTALANYNYCMGHTADEKTDASASLDVAKVAMQQAETKYNDLKVNSGIDPNELAIAEATLKQAATALTLAQKKVSGIILTASMDGTVVYLAAESGAVVDTSKYLTIADLSHPTVTVTVDETDLDKLVVGNQAELVFDALPAQTFTGKVTRVDPELSTQDSYQVATGQVELDAPAATVFETLPLGLNATVQVISKEVKDALYVPNEAVRDLGNNEYAVFVVGSDGALKLTPVEVGIADITHTEITSGLNLGDVVSTGITETTSNTTSK
jgi:HlyD family secretion protein